MTRFDQSGYGLYQTYTRGPQRAATVAHTAQAVTSPQELEALERDIRQRTDRLGSLLVGYHMQQALRRWLCKPSKNSW